MRNLLASEPSGQGGRVGVPQQQLLGQLPLLPAITLVSEVWDIHLAMCRMWWCFQYRKRIRTMYLSLPEPDDDGKAAGSGDAAELILDAKGGQNNSRLQSGQQDTYGMAAASYLYINGTVVWYLAINSAWGLNVCCSSNSVAGSERTFDCSLDLIEDPQGLLNHSFAACLQEAAALHRCQHKAISIIWLLMQNQRNAGRPALLLPSTSYQP